MNCILPASLLLRVCTCVCPLLAGAQVADLEPPCGDEVHHCQHKVIGTMGLLQMGAIRRVKSEGQVVNSTQLDRSLMLQSSPGEELMDKRSKWWNVPAVKVLGSLVVVLMALAALRGACGSRAIREPRQDFAGGDQSQLNRIVNLAGSSLFCMGYNMGIIAGAMLQLERDAHFSSGGSLSTGAPVSSFLAGACAGSVLGLMADRSGRKKGVLMAQALFVVAAPVMFLAPNMLTLALGRAIAGVGVGLSSGLVNMYISEFAPASIRGELNGWATFLGVGGNVFAQVVSLLFTSLQDPAMAWRLQLGLILVPAVPALLLQALLLPESPRWLLLQGRREDAQAAFTRIFPGTRVEAISELLDEIMAGHKHNGGIDSVALSSIRDAVSNSLHMLFEHRKSAAVGVAINVLQQITGVNIIVFYGPMILEMAGFGTTHSMLVTVLVSMLALAGGVANVSAIDLIGRRSVAIIGLCSMILAHGLLVTAFLIRAGGQQGPHGHVWAAVVMIIGMLTFRFSFSFSLGPLPYIMTSELFPQEVRGCGVALSWLANWAANFGMCLTFPIIQAALTGAMGMDVGSAVNFGIYLCCCAVALVCVERLMPETSGLTLEAVRM